MGNLARQVSFASAGWLFIGFSSGILTRQVRFNTLRCTTERLWRVFEQCSTERSMHRITTRMQCAQS